LNSETEEQQSPADQLHWSFSDGPNLTKVVFPGGFSAAESTLPTGEFDPSSDWEQAYDVVFPGYGSPPDQNEALIYFGSLRLAARFDGDQLHMVVHGVRQLGQDFSRERQNLEARFTCRRESLFPLMDDRAWSVRTRLTNNLDPAVKGFARLDQTGRLSKGCIEWKNSGGRWIAGEGVDQSRPLVCDWALLAAVQVLPPEDLPVEFAQLQALERLHARQVISFLGLFSARFGAREVTVKGFVQRGEGMLPSFFWVDDQGRLLIARYGMYALVYNPNPRLDTEVYHGE